MDSEEDVRPLIDEEVDEYSELPVDSSQQRIEADPEFEQVVYGYRISSLRTALMYMLTVLLLGTPRLLFHWYPTWRLYATARRCRLQQADRVLVVETYQKKCQSFYIHRVRRKCVADTNGVANAGYEQEAEDGGGGGGARDKPPAAPAARTAPLHLDDGTVAHVSSYRYFVHKKCVLVWDETRATFVRLAGIESGASCAELQRAGAAPPCADRRVAMLNIYGLNEISVPVHTIPALILLEVFNPFYMFQAFTIGVWLAENYYYYCGAVVLMSTFGVTTSVIQTRQNQSKLRATVEAHETVVVAPARATDSRRVAPGDVVLLPPAGCTMHFDAVLLDGSCIVNESMLTGESVPVTKTALPRVERPYDPTEHAAHTLFCGTRVIQTRFYNNEPVKALVLRTGYNTSKGQLVRSILYPVPADFKFDRDTYKFIIILAVIALLGLVYTILLKASRALTVGDIIIKALDIITIVIPPALPAAMTVGRLYAVSRLQRARVYCLNTRAVNVSGSVDCVCFDKTGTLTEEGLDMWGVVPASAATAPPRLAPPLADPRVLNDLDDLKLGMATCHSLTLLDGVLSGDPLDLKMFESTGWELEEPDIPDTSKYELLVPTVVYPRRPTNISVDDMNVPLEVGVVQQHQFVSSLQRSSVVARVLHERMFRAYCKGSPEMLRTLCLPETVPLDLDDVLSSYAEKGYRVIALASKLMEVEGYTQLQRTTRDQVECDLNFLGLIILENRLKPATTGVIKELKDANMHVVMITGDNILTAVSVAKECGIVAAGERLVTLQARSAPHAKAPLLYCSSSLRGVPVGNMSVLSLDKSLDSGHFSDWTSSGSADNSQQKLSSSMLDTSGESGGTARYKIAMTGDTWAVLKEHYPALVARVVARGAVFARMSSDQKQQLIVEYQSLGYYVAMCGDGANDCGALRAAHTGVSLSELESSVAAPFTSRTADISCMARVVREGRAALATSFGVFKFMVSYSLAEFLSVALLYYFDSNLTDFQFLFIDVALVVNFAFFFGRTAAHDGPLCRVPPLASLLSFAPLASLVGHALLVCAAQYLAYFLLTRFPWYERHVAAGATDYECWENYAVYVVSTFQYVTLAIAFSHGAPYRRSVVTNAPLVLSALLTTGVCAYVAIAPARWLASFLQLRLPPEPTFAYLVLMLAAMHFAAALFFERFVVQFLLQERQCVPRCLKERRVRKTPHLALARRLSDSDYLERRDVATLESDGPGLPAYSTTM